MHLKGAPWPHTEGATAQSWHVHTSFLAQDHQVPCASQDRSPAWCPGACSPGSVDPVSQALPTAGFLWVTRLPSPRRGAPSLLQPRGRAVITSLQGRILANDVAMEDIEVTAKNGRMYTLGGVLIPPSILPILPQRCDETQSETVQVRKQGKRRERGPAAARLLRAPGALTTLPHLAYP